MKDECTSKEQLIHDLEEARKRIAELEQSPAGSWLEDKARLIAIMEATSDLVAITKPNGQGIYMNASGLRMLGYSEDEDVRKYDLSAAHPHWAYRTVIEEGVPEALAHGMWRGETAVLTKDGREIPVSQVIMVHRSSDGKPEFISTIIRDISEQKRVEESLRNQRDLSQMYLDIAGVMMVALDRHGDITLINKKGCEILGLGDQDLIGRNWFDTCVPEESREETREVFTGLMSEETVEAEYYENPVVMKDGEIRIIAFHNKVLRDSSGNITGTLSSGEDITERKHVEEELLKYREKLEDLVTDRTVELEEKNVRLKEEIGERERAEGEKKRIEAQLAQTQRIEALDRFAGGIAHDLNNILSPIIINLEELLVDSPKGSSPHEILDQTLRAAYRQRDLVKKILSFSRRSERVLKPIRIIPLLEETLNFLKSSLPSTIEIRQIIDVQNDVITGDPVQIQQIVMNLCRNAADAMESQKGTIEVGLTNTRIESQNAYPGMKAGDYLTLTVKDTGNGMKPEVMDRVFEPFFTNKGIGKGTGMGLSVVYGIVKSHGGAITVESGEGEGSLFTTYLPLSKAAIEAPSPENENIPSVKGKERILLIDDEEFILSSLGRALESSGYRVTTLKDGFEAFRLLNEIPGEFDLVITDLTMPGMTGLELSRKIKDVRPDIPIILCTGFNDVISRQEAQSSGIEELILKPAGTNEVRTVVRRALDHCHD